MVRLQDSKDMQEKDREIGLLYDQGSFLLCLGKYEEAIKYYDMILKLKPCSKIALGYKGLALIKLKKRAEAIHCYQMALNC